MSISEIFSNFTPVFLKVCFPGGGSHLTPPSIFPKELIQYQYNFMKLLNNHFKVL